MRLRKYAVRNSMGRERGRYFTKRGARTTAARLNDYAQVFRVNADWTVVSL